MTKVSIIIPVYNVEKYLPACLDSVLGQTMRDIEVICVDDASTDGCPEILAAYAAKDPRMKIIRLEENSQQAFARNRGMEIAEGKYIYLIDSDDMIEPEAMEELYELAERDALDGIFFDSKVIYDNDELKRKHTTYITQRRGTYSEDVTTGAELFDAFVRQDEWTCYIQRQFWNRSFLERENIRFPEGHEHEDEVFPFEALLLAERVRYIPKDYFIRRFRENSVVTSPPAGKNFYGYFRCFIEMADFMEERGIGLLSAEINTARMYELMGRLYDRLHDQEDLSRFFVTPEEQRLYRFYIHSLRKDVFWYRPLSVHLKEALEQGQYRYIYLYGAGAFGRRMYHRLTRDGWPVQGFLVTSREGNPDWLFGRPVMTPGELPEGEENRIVIITVSKGFRPEIQKLLDKREIPWISMD